VTDDHVIDLDQIGSVVAAQRAAGLILMGTNASDEDVVNLVLAGSVDSSELGFTAARLECSGCGEEMVTTSAVCFARV